jgi:post-segregation antitoxin (ccd killing protein)
MSRRNDEAALSRAALLLGVICGEDVINVTVDRALNEQLKTLGVDIWRGGSGSRRGRPRSSVCATG